MTINIVSGYPRPATNNGSTTRRSKYGSACQANVDSAWKFGACRGRRAVDVSPYAAASWLTEEWRAIRVVPPFMPMVLALPVLARPKGQNDCAGGQCRGERDPLRRRARQPDARRPRCAPGRADPRPANRLLAERFAPRPSTTGDVAVPTSTRLAHAQLPQLGARMPSVHRTRSLAQPRAAATFSRSPRKVVHAPGAGSSRGSVGRSQTPAVPVHFGVGHLILGPG